MHGAELLATLMQSAIGPLIAPIAALTAWLAAMLKIDRRPALTATGREKWLTSTGC